VASRLGELLRAHRAGCTPLTALEVGFSARTAAEFDSLTGALEVFDAVPVTDGDYARAGAVQRLLASQGQRGRKLPDLLIAAVAERTGLTVLHYDRDFALIAEATEQSHEWVVPPGTID
jgi:predicted nucleic acid-binding protein